MLVEHPLVAAELVRVRRRPAEDLTPPRGHVATVLCVYAAREEGRDELVLFHSVVERVDHTIEGLTATGPLVE